MRNQTTGESKNEVCKQEQADYFGAVTHPKMMSMGQMIYVIDKNGTEVRR